MHRYLILLVASACVACGPAEQGTSQPPHDEGAAAPPEAPAASDVRGEELSYEIGGVNLTGFLAYDANQEGQRPGVLVVHEWWGHNDYARMRARMLAEMGYTALALDMYGDGKQADHPEDAQKFMNEVLSNMEAGQARFEAARALLEDHETTDASKTAAIGYCFGGGVVLHMARFGLDLDGVASFHGSLGTETPAAAGSVKSRILVLHGADDPFVAPDVVKAFEQEMADAGADMTFIAYPDTVHSFTNPGATEVGEKFELPLRYSETADKASWAELDRFLREVFAD